MADILITPDYFGGEEGFNSILNDYYENEINELPASHRLKARKFIEEGLIVGGRRVGVTEGVEKERYQIDERLLHELLDSRLIRTENTHLGKSYEVSHDTLVAPILESFQKRKLREEREAKARELQVARRRMITAGGLALLGFALAALATVFYFQAQRERTNAEQAFMQFKEEQLKSTTAFYNTHIGNGHRWLALRDYQRAEDEFWLALSIAEKFSKIDTAGTPIDGGGLQARSGINLAKGIKVRKEEFTQLIKLADSLFYEGRPEDLVEAKTIYKKAAELNYDDPLVTGRLNEIEGKLKTAFNEFVRKGEIFYDAEDYKLALGQLRHAREIRPNDKGVRTKIENCKKRLR